MNFTQTWTSLLFLVLFKMSKYKNKSSIIEWNTKFCSGSKIWVDLPNKTHSVREKRHGVDWLTRSPPNKDSEHSALFKKKKKNGETVRLQYSEGPLYHDYHGVFISTWVFRKHWVFWTKRKETKNQSSAYTTTNLF